MGKNAYLLNIYFKIHNKRTLTVDDLRYLAQYDPECFAKTCENVVYNIPETKPIMQEEKVEPVNEQTAPEPTEAQRIQKILDNLRRLEADDFLFKDVNADKVKNLLGSLYMELLFPHNDKDTYFPLPTDEHTSGFDAKI